MIETSKPEDFTIEGKWVTEYRGTSPHVVIPEGTIRVEDGMFIGSDIESIIIPEGWTHIPGEMFFECFKLKEIKLPSTLECIGSHAFYGCINLRHIELPESLTEIRFSAFAESGIEEITFPEGMKSLGQWAFKNCPYLTTVNFPESPMTLENDAFLYASKLKNINGLPEIKTEKINRGVGEEIPHTDMCLWDAKFIFRGTPYGDAIAEQIDAL